MGKSQTKRLREATKRFGREDRNRLANARADLSSLIYKRKVEAGLISLATAAVHPAHNAPTRVKRYSTSLTYLENEDKFGRPLK